MRILNRRARRNYKLFERFEAGIALAGSEVKSIKLGRIDISSAFVKIRDTEAFLVNANIPSYQGVGQGYDPLRRRKLLLKKSELISLGTKVKQQKLTIIPVRVYTKGRLVKIELALAKSKKKYEKKEELKRKDQELEIERELKRG